MMVIGIVGILSSIALNSYAQYLYRAEITQVVVDMGGISRRIDMFRTETGLLPASFDQIGVVVLDPWGNPYQYLPIAASMSSGSNGNSGNGNGNSGNGNGNSGNGSGNGNGNGNQNGNSTGGSNGVGQLRKDKNLVPINSDYDLYSMGKDGRSVSPLTAQPSRDDIIRANNGAYIGLAEKY